MGALPFSCERLLLACYETVIVFAWKKSVRIVPQINPFISGSWELPYLLSKKSFFLLIDFTIEVRDKMIQPLSDLTGYPFSETSDRSSAARGTDHSSDPTHFYGWAKRSTSQ